MSDKLFRAHRSLYNHLADEYEARAGHRITDATQRVQRLASFVPPGGSVIDVGCGVGLTVQSLNAVGFLAHGLDASHEMARYARIRNPSTRIMVGDLRNLCSPGIYDALVADAVIHLFPGRLSIAVLDSLRTFVRPGGIVSVSTTPHKFSSEGWRTKHGYSSTRLRYRKEWTSDELTSAFEQAGLEVLDSYEVKDQEGKIWTVLTGVSRNPGNLS